MSSSSVSSAPVAAQARDGFLGLRHHAQGVVLADLDAQRAALAGVGVDGDREQAPAALALFLLLRPVGLGGTELEVAERFAEELEFLGELLPLGLGRLGYGGVDGLVDERADAHAIPRDHAAQLLLQRAHGAAQVARRPAAALDARHRRVENVGHRAHQAGDGRIRAFGVAVAAGRAFRRIPLRILEADLRHVAEDAGGRGNERGADEGIDQVVRALAGGVEAAGLLPEAVDVRHAAVAFRHLPEHHRQAGGLVTKIAPCRAD
ncbi:MAG: hypothetical protein L6Q52_07970 [Rhodocyclaceae bacterium]|nr:hypothetical protein [Rhodocyclaceae bacterium]